MSSRFEYQRAVTPAAVVEAAEPSVGVDAGSSKVRSAQANHPVFVPDRFEVLVHPAVVAEDQEPVERASKPTVVGDAQHCPLITGQAVL